MAEAAAATHLPMLSLSPVASREDALAARAYGADAVLLEPSLADADRETTASSARSTRMVALPLCASRAEVERAVSSGAKALVLRAADVNSLGELASAAPRLVVIAWPTSSLADELTALRGVVDSVIVDVDVYGATGFERLVSELG
jgi:indole-3-glycerol phosphate synthase